MSQKIAPGSVSGSVKFGEGGQGLVVGAGGGGGVVDQFVELLLLLRFDNRVGVAGVELLEFVDGDLDHGGEHVPGGVVRQDVESVEQALEHPYLHIWHDASDEPDCPTTFNFDFEVIDDVGEMRRVILEEVMRFRQTVRTLPGAAGALPGLGQQTGAGQVPLPQQGGQWTAEDPRPQEYIPHGGNGLEQDLQAGLDSRR